MILSCQEYPILRLQDIANSDTHSILIEGPQGSGKSYLAKYFGTIKNIPDIVSIDPNVQNIRDMIDRCIDIDNDVVILIENLDLGVLGASYTLLKFLEEPRSNIYIVVTARSLAKVPDTILSRSSIVTIGNPTDKDINLYASEKNLMKYHQFNTTKLWKVVRSFKDVDLVYGLTLDNVNHYLKISFSNILRSPVSSAVWSLMKYEDGSDIPIHFMIRYILCNEEDMHIKRCCIDCLNELDNYKIGIHSIISKFVIECKYGGG